MNPEPPSGDARGGYTRAAQAGLGRPPRLDVPRGVLEFHRAAVLDPDYAVNLPGDRPLHPTVYVPAAIKVNGLPGKSAQTPFKALKKAAEKQGYHADFESDDRELAAHVADGPFEDLVDRYWVSRVVLRPMTEAPAKRPDSWKVLQQVRADKPSESKGIGLVHVMTACAPDLEGVPAYDGHGWEGVPAYDGHGFEGVPAYDGHGGVGGLPAYDGHAEPFGRPGYGSRTPVHWGGRDPWRKEPVGPRRPVVCVMDTGIGEHPWFTHGVRELREYAGVTVGMPELPSTDPELHGLRPGLSGLLDRDAGHGTFIAGLIRQYCPSAEIIAVPVMASDGSADDTTFQRALVLVLLRHLESLAAQNPDGIIDVLSLSLGYYHEKPEDLAADAIIEPLLREFGENGVAVVCAAGNDATLTPMFPAAFSSNAGSQHRPERVPQMTVGALNPDGQTIAIYSNAGPWVSTHRRATAVVSTIPVTFNAAVQSGTRVDSPVGVRASVDPDNFASGFALWSGTSFAAPVLAGQLAQHLAKDARIGAIDRKTAVARAWSAVTAELMWGHS